MLKAVEILQIVDGAEVETTLRVGDHFPVDGGTIEHLSVKSEHGTYTVGVYTDKTPRCPWPHEPAVHTYFQVNLHYPHCTVLQLIEHQDKEPT